LRALKLTYVINNFLNRKKLKHNKAIYKKLGIKKSIYSPLGKQDIEDINLPGPWLDDDNAIEKVKAHPTFQNFSSKKQEQVLNFITQGYLILPNFYTKEEVKAFNDEIQQLIDQKKLDFNYTGKKIVESYKVSPLVNDNFFRNAELLEIFEFIFDRDVVPFHTINFIEGSEQKAHSDSIHMSTAPEGFMAAAWAALESTDENNGPLFYYPGSHRFPYIGCLDYDSGNSKYLIGDNSYANYEKHIEKLVEEHQLEKKYFFANPGDVLIWHANLLHGGDKILKKGRTRKSMVAHFFGKDVLCFHEISQRPALLNIE
jgi:ectoine hydroxylase-related dioxygenase (phytanoyl-CoA dioxygenase family)